jgi:hypothetical protein
MGPTTPLEIVSGKPGATEALAYEESDLLCTQDIRYTSREISSTLSRLHAVSR